MVRQVNNDISKNPRYITRSKISRAELNKMGIPRNVSVDEAQKAFDDCPHYSWEVLGNPYNENRQRHVKFVSKQALYREIIKGFYHKK